MTGYTDRYDWLLASTYKDNIGELQWSNLKHQK